MKSGYIRKVQELSAPYERKNKLYKLLLLIWCVLEIGFVTGNIILKDYRPLFSSLVWWMLGAAMFLAIAFIQNMMKLSGYRHSVQSFQECIEKSQLTDGEILAVDRILKQMQEGVCTYRAAETRITFSPKLCVAVIEENGEIIHISIGRVEDLEKVKVSFFEPGEQYDFELFCKECPVFDFSVTVNREVQQEEISMKEEVLSLIKENYPHIIIEEEKRS